MIVPLGGICSIKDGPDSLRHCLNWKQHSIHCHPAVPPPSAEIEVWEGRRKWNVYLKGREEKRGDEKGRDEKKQLRKVGKSRVD